MKRLYLVAVALYYKNVCITSVINNGGKGGIEKRELVNVIQ